MGQYVVLSAGTAILTLTGDAGGAITPVANNVTIAGGTNIGTVGTAGTITINLDDNVTLVGYLEAGGDITTTGGDLNVDTGDVVVTLGGVVTGAAIAAGTTVTAGTGITATTGDITASTGDFVSTLGAVDAATTVTAGTGITATTGDITASTGDFVSTLGAVDAATTVTAGTGITATTGDITASTGDFVSTLGAVDAATTVTAGTGITATTGDITASTGDFIATLGSVYATTFDTYVAAAGVTLSGTSLLADGTDANIDINITAKGSGQVIIDDLQLTTDLAVTEGGTGVSALTDHCVFVGSGTAAVTILAVGTNGQVIVGSTGADPVFANIGSTDGTITVTEGAGTLVIEGTDASTTQEGVVELTTDAEAVAGTDTTRAVTAAALKAKLGAQTSHGLPYGAGTTAAIAWTAEPSDGQFLIGDTAAIPQLGTITAGTGITVTNAAHAITVASTGTTLNDQTGTSYTLVLTDAGKFITFTNAAAIAVTVPTNASVAFPIGTQIGFQQGGAGQVTFSGAVPPTLKSADNAYTTVKLYSVGYMIKIATDVWALGGDLEA